jgi:hypothetical protein
MLEKKRQAEFRKRRGNTKRTIVQSIWLGMAGVGAYFLIAWLNSSETFTYDDAYRAGVPNAVPEWGILVGGIIIMVLVAQLIFILGYLIGSPAGRTRAGTASVHSYNDELGAGFDDDEEDDR